MTRVKIFSAIFMICLLSVYGNELSLNNPGFEEWGDNLPQGWSAKVWDMREGITRIYAGTVNPRTGNKCLVIENLENNDARVVQTVNVDNETIYELSCWVKTERLNPAHIGAYISVLELNEVTWDIRQAKTGWQKMVVYVRAAHSLKRLTIALGLGGFGSINTGKVMFDDVMIREVDAIPDPNAAVINMGAGIAKISKFKVIPHTSFEVTLMLAFFFINAALAALYSVFRKQGRPILPAILKILKKNPAALNNKAKGT